MERLRAMIDAALERADQIGADLTGIYLDRARHATDEDEAGVLGKDPTVGGAVGDATPPAARSRHH